MLKAFLTNAAGTSSLEYALILVVIAVGITGAIQTVSA